MAKMFIDIETIPNDELGEEFHSLLAKKFASKEEIDTLGEEQIFNERAWLYAEFWRIICISIWYIRTDWTYSLKSFVHHDERTLLLEFCDGIGKSGHIRIWHNVKSFDLPFLVKRMWINSVPVPASLDFIDKKPREVNVLDTMEIWRWTWQRNQNTSLDLICRCLSIPTPKENWDWSKVRDRYKEDKLDTISKYCEWDVEATMQVFEKIYK